MLSTLQSLRLPHLSLALAGLMCAFPFLIPIHNYPLTTFYQEWSSAMLGVLALSLLAARDFWEKPKIPRIALLPAALIAVVLLQWGLGKVAYFDQALMFVLYFLFAALLTMLGARLRECLGMAKLAQVLAIFLLVGAELSALVGVLQHYRWHTFLDSVIVNKVSFGVYGNLAQPNHFANYIALGLISLGLLYQQQRLKVGYVALLAVPLLFVLTLSGSRSAWLYLLLMITLAWVMARRDSVQRSLVRYSLLLLAGFGVMHLIVQLPFMAGAEGATNSMERLFSGGASGAVRLYLWRESWLIFTQSPWLGVGFGQYAWHHFQLLPVLQQGSIVGLYNNAHNIVFHLAAETGLAGLLVLAVALGIWLRGLRHATLDVEHWWTYAVLGVLVIHSLLEYPMWYTYFMAIAALLLGALDETHYRLELRRVGRISVMAILLLGLVSLLQLFSGFRKLETVLAIPRASGVEREATMARVRDGLIAVHSGSMLSAYAELSLSSFIEVNDKHLKEKLALNTRVMRFVPIGTVVYRQALLLAQANQLEQAKTLLVQAIWSYPQEFPRAHQLMEALAQKDPAHFSALLEFGLQKAQEYHHAVYKQ